MPRGHWCIVVAALGCLASAPQPRAQSEQPKPKAEQPKPTPAAPANAKAIEAIEPPEYYRPCQENGQDRNSDLCAQWTAAHGAADAAYWAKWSFWIGLAGLGGLISTLYYTRKAVLAAEEATADADKAIEIAGKNADAATALAETSHEAMQNDLRAWLGVSCVVEESRPFEGSVHLSVRVTLRNYGKSPAPSPYVSFITYARTNMGTEGSKERQFQSHPFEPVMPNETSSESFQLEYGKDILDEIETIRAEEGAYFIMLCFRVICTYRTVFSTQADLPRHSKVAYTVSGKPTDPEVFDQGEWYRTLCSPRDLNVWPTFSGLKRLT